MRICRVFIAILLMLSVADAGAQQVDYSVASVPEESGRQLVKVTSDADCVCMPIVKRSKTSVDWFSNRILDVSADGNGLAYLAARDGTTNVFVKRLSGAGASMQRTKRSSVIDFSYSSDGSYLCFSEKKGKTNQIFQTDAVQGYVCRQITSGAVDYSPVYSADVSQIFFARQEQEGISIWSYDIQNNYLSVYTEGMNPFPVAGEPSFVCVRVNDSGKGEVWKVDYRTGAEECIVSDAEKSFASPVVSPDGRWMAFVGSSRIVNDEFSYMNTDIYAARTDGSELVQLTFHAADDVSPVWSRDGRYIYFISQRGSKGGIANVWRMDFNL